MSVQNLPLDIKNQIKEDIDSYMFDEDAREGLPFYISLMFEKDGWSEKGATFLNYLNDLDTARNTNWKESLCGLAKQLNG